MSRRNLQFPQLYARHHVIECRKSAKSAHILLFYHQFTHKNTYFSSNLPAKPPKTAKINRFMAEKVPQPAQETTQTGFRRVLCCLQASKRAPNSIHSSPAPPAASPW
jgi:hypothetical protein